MRGMWLACAAGALGLLAAAPGADADLLFEVNRANDLPDSAIGDHSCDTQPLAGDQCTLRAAIQESNVEPGSDGIDFNIPGRGIKTIAPHTELPAISGPVEIDGYTQGAASPNTKPLGDGDNAILLVELDGENAPPVSSGLTLEPGADGSLIQGLVINRFATGMLLKADSTIRGNFIGTTPSGNVALSNDFDGIFYQSATVLIGGQMIAGYRNLISGNGRHAINGTGDLTVQGNYIGTQRDGRSPLPNMGSGIRIFDSGNAIGGVAGGNVIAFNASDGVTMFNRTIGNSVTRNRIFSNGGLGIDLNDDGRTPNDAGDGDAGPNELQNFPAILSATRAADGSVTLSGRLQSTPNQHFTLEFFKNSRGGDEGARFLGRKGVDTAATGLGSFTFHVGETFSPGVSVRVGDWVTATASNTNGSTSEFSAPRKVVAG